MNSEMNSDFVIKTPEELENYRAAIHADVLSRNPNRDFEILFGNATKLANGNREMECLIILLDDKGPIND